MLIRPYPLHSPTRPYGTSLRQNDAVLKCHIASIKRPSAFLSVLKKSYAFICVLKTLLESKIRNEKINLKIKYFLFFRKISSEISVNFRDLFSCRSEKIKFTIFLPRVWFCNHRVLRRNDFYINVKSNSSRKKTVR